MSDEYKEQYASRSQNDKKIGETVFRDILDKASKCWKQPPNEDFLKKFVEYGMLFSQSSTHKFRKALDHLVQNKDAFPSIADLREAISRVPKAPIDFIEKLDTRSTCTKCMSSGIQSLVNPGLGVEHHGYCSCSIGQYLQRIGSQGVRTADELRRNGYRTKKEIREGK